MVQRASPVVLHHRDSGSATPTLVLGFRSVGFPSTTDLSFFAKRAAAANKMSKFLQISLRFFIQLDCLSFREIKGIISPYE